MVSWRIIGHPFCLLSTDSRTPRRICDLKHVTEGNACGARMTFKNSPFEGVSASEQQKNKMKEQPKILDQKTSDNEYLHKDFHGVLCYAIKYLDEYFGPESTEEYLKQVGNTYFSLLSDQLTKNGLPVIEKHFRDVFKKGKGNASFEYDKDILKIIVHSCPAITHLKKSKQLFTERFCESTVVVNEVICNNAGFRSSCVYQPGRGACIQKFWKDK
jgi:hypothetical protein